MSENASQKNEQLPFILILAAGLLAGVVTICLNILGNLRLNPAAVMLGALFGLCYIVILLPYSFFVKLLPPRYVLWLPVALVWGSGTAMAFVYVSGQGVNDLFDQLGLSIFVASFAGAWPEEIGKGVGTLLILLSFNSLNKPWHGLIVGAFVGLGFTVLENIGYGSVAGLLDPSSDLSGVAHVWMLRTVAGPAQHAVYSGIIGFGLALALFGVERSMRWRWSVATAFFALGFGCHFLWNTSPESMAINMMTMASAAIIGYGTFIYLAVKSYNGKKKLETVAV